MSQRSWNEGCYWKSDGWEYFSFNVAGLTAEDVKTKLYKLLEGIRNPGSILKHDHRSAVYLTEIEGIPCIVKDFILQKTWVWFQITSLLWQTPAEIACRNALALKDIGLVTPQPMLLMQKRKFGLVIESLLIYPYLEGIPATPANSETIVGFVRKLHDAGWIHRDPHPGNFLLTPSGTATIDVLRLKRTNSRYLKAYDVMLMEHDMPDAPDLYGRSNLGVHFCMAKLGHNIVRFYRSSKHAIRRSVGLGRSGNLMKSTERGN